MLSVLMITPAMASDPQLVAFEEICEITGEVKTGLRYFPIPLAVDTVVEGFDLE